MRITDTWNSTSYSIETVLGTTTENTMVLEIDSDGNFTQTTTVSPFPESVTTGTWGFNSDKTALLLTEGSNVDTWDIIKLKNKELKLKQVGSVLGSETTTVIEFSGE
ncbi:MAG: hypothetical protein MK066_05995 [Crocinitomicaceae bacterium]|nr:hypothetical protein [Crocinitomicaceae bacterium]